MILPLPVESFGSNYDLWLWSRVLFGIGSFLDILPSVKVLGLKCFTIYQSRGVSRLAVHFLM